jgi:uncharacterized phage-associated protein
MFIMLAGRCYVNVDSVDTAKPGTDFDKLREMICFFAAKGGQSLGKTKLMKLLYYSDFGRYAIAGQSISGATYSKYPRGPVPEDAFTVIDQLVRENVLIPKPVFVAGYRQESHVLNGDCELTHLISEEQNMLSLIWGRWRVATASEIVSASHADAPWQSVDMYEEIPYALAHFIEPERLGL